MKGRSLAVRKQAGETLFNALKAEIRAIYDRRPIALSLEIQELDPEVRWKQGNIREYMARRAN
jgi:5-carboxymethyl-2-hydroxymuconate isomerase